MCLQRQLKLSVLPSENPRAYFSIIKFMFLIVSASYFAAEHVKIAKPCCFREVFFDCLRTTNRFYKIMSSLATLSHSKFSNTEWTKLSMFGVWYLLLWIDFFTAFESRANIVELNFLTMMTNDKLKCLSEQDYCFSKWLCFKSSPNLILLHRFCLLEFYVLQDVIFGTSCKNLFHFIIFWFANFLIRLLHSVPIDKQRSEQIFDCIYTTVSRSTKFLSHGFFWQIYSH